MYLYSLLIETSIFYLKRFFTTVTVTPFHALQTVSSYSLYTTVTEYSLYIAIIQMQLRLFDSSIDITRHQGLEYC